jgi:DNA end-binding protein Ku
LPKRPRKRASATDATAVDTDESQAPAVRPIWSGTIAFGLVSIPVELLSAIRPRQTAMKLVDTQGHALGRQYHCSKEGKKLDYDELVRGYETEDGKLVEITDQEFESVAPEMSGDIELRNFVPLEQIPPLYFQRPYFLAPAGKSVKAYRLLAATMERSGRVGIGSFVMRGHEYLVAILSDNGVLRADTLRYADEIRTPETVGLPKRSKPAAAKVTQFIKEIEALTKREIDVSELKDTEAQALQALVAEKQKHDEGVVHSRGLEDADADAAESGAKVIDLMAVLRKSLSKSVVVRSAAGEAPIDLAERRAARKQAAQASAPSKKKPVRRKAPKKRARRQ